MKPSSLPTIGIVIGSTRSHRFGDRPAQWIFDVATQRSDMAFELVDLRDHPMPFFDERSAPLQSPARDAYAQRWAAVVDRLDGFIVVTPEYNHGPNAALKNAFDHGGKEWARKPIGFVGYGHVGAARAIEQLRLASIELPMVSVRPAVHIAGSEFLAISDEPQRFKAVPDLEHSAVELLNHIGWWSSLLTAGRRPVEEHGLG